MRGAQLALKTQIPVLVMVAVSIAALAMGALLNEPVSLAPSVTPSESTEAVGFWVVFAIFFPAVTGVMAGLGLSGDLEDPRRSIPIGSIAATLTGLVVYLGVVWLLSAGATPEALTSDQMIWSRIAPLGPLLIFPGLWGAIFSSAVGSMLGAPRTLQALIADRTASGSRLHRLVTSRAGEPRAGMALSLGLALMAVFLGDLNTVAEVVSMFFLTVYGAVNLVAALETLSGDATWRPRIRVPWWLSLIGGIGCFAVMFLINATASIVAMSVELGLWLLFTRLERRADWGDIRRDIYEATIRWALVKLRDRPMTARNWRPHLMVFADQIERRIDLVRFGNWFSQGRGVVTVCELVVGDLLDQSVDPHARRLQIDEILRSEGIVAFAEVDMVSSIERGIIDVVQANGMAGLDSNTIMLGWRNDRERLAAFLRILRRLERLHKSIIIARPAAWAPARQGKERLIHVWWGGLQRNGDLMLLLAHLLTRNPEWRGAKICVMSIASNENTKKDTEAQLAHLLPEARIDAETRVLVKPKDSSVRQVIHSESSGADLVFLGLGTPELGDEESYAERLMELAEGLPTTFFVKNASLFVGELV